MDAKEAIAEPHRMLATVGFFHQATGEGTITPQIPSPTFFRVRKTPLIVDCVVRHGGVVLSKRRRVGW